MGFLDRFFGGVPDRKAFGALAIETMKKGGETRPITFDERRFQVVVGDPGKEMNILWLGNAYEEYCALPKSERAKILERYKPAAYANVDAFDRKEDALRSLLPRVRDRAYPHLLAPRMRRQFGKDLKDMPSLPYRALGEVFAVSLCIDLPTTVMDCTSQNYDRWKASFDELFPQALENLKLISKEPFRQVAPGVFVSPWADSHDPARLLLPELFRALPLKGAPVAAVPNRTTLIVTGADDAAGLDELVSQMKLGLKDPRPLSSMPLVLGADGEWRPFDPPATPVGAELKLLAAQCRIGLYADQKATLEEDFESSGRDVFVATYSVMRKRDSGELVSFASWTDGVNTLLPKTDHVSFVELHGDKPEDAEVTMVPWNVAQAVAGELMKQVPGLWPERFSVEAFPSAAQLAKLKASA